MSDASANTADDRLTVRVYPYREKGAMGNIMWPGKYEMRYGKFPKGHPVGGGFPSSRGSSEYGDSDAINAFRDRGYWASCFPEGDGITWKPLQGQTDARCIADIRECFGWDARWAHGVTINADAINEGTR